jgi:hypothetical protein
LELITWLSNENSRLSTVEVIKLNLYPNYCQRKLILQPLGGFEAKCRVDLWFRDQFVGELEKCLEWDRRMLLLIHCPT